jgi:hypothetical protein
LEIASASIRHRFRRLVLALCAYCAGEIRQDSTPAATPPNGEIWERAQSGRNGPQWDMPEYTALSLVKIFVRRITYWIRQSDSKVAFDVVIVGEAEGVLQELKFVSCEPGDGRTYRDQSETTVATVSKSRDLANRTTSLTWGYEW